MTAEDVEKGGWWATDLPANQEWLCPECRTSSLVALWEEQEVPCEDCGTHDGRRCPACGEVYEHTWGSVRLDEARHAPA